MRLCQQYPTRESTYYITSVQYLWIVHEWEVEKGFLCRIVKAAWEKKEKS